jgi:hypothetical protein
MNKKTKFCGYSSAIFAGSNKPGKSGQVIKCGHCGQLVKLRRPPHGAIGWYVQIPRHKVQVSEVAA